MPTNFPYYQYAISSSGGATNGQVTSAGTAVLVTEADGRLTDANSGGSGHNATPPDTFTISGVTYTLTGGFATGPYAGNFVATNPAGTYFYFSNSPSVAITFDVNAQTDFFGKIGGTVIGSVAQLDNLDIALTCFLAGTMIRTPEGATAIDKLGIGDLVVTAGGTAKPVKFIGRQTVSMLFSDKLKSQPILIKAGALAENIPARDLYTSPGHAMLVDGVLAISGALVNGRSIVRWTDSPTTFTYYHIELEDHDIVFAEGAPTETYCDNVPREVFDNAAEYQALYPDARPIQQLDLPTVKSARQLPLPTRRRLAERANAIGVAAEKAA